MTNYGYLLSLTILTSSENQIIARWQPRGKKAFVVQVGLSFQFLLLPYSKALKFILVALFLLRICFCPWPLKSSDQTLELQILQLFLQLKGLHPGTD